MEPLTLRELDCVKLLWEGYSNSSIGSELNISRETVKKHLNTAMKKTNTATRIELAMKMFKEFHDIYAK